MESLKEKGEYFEDIVEDTTKDSFKVKELKGTQLDYDNIFIFPDYGSIKAKSEKIGKVNVKK